VFLTVSANIPVSRAVNVVRARQRQFDVMRQQLRQTRGEMRRRLGQRDRQIAEQSRQLAEQERALAELNRRIVEYDQRFDDIAAEIARVRVADVKQKHISASDAAPASSSGDGSLPKQSGTLPTSEISITCRPQPLSVGAMDHTRSASTNKTIGKKRTASPQPRQSKHCKKSVGPAAAKNVRRLRSGRQLVYK